MRLEKGRLRKGTQGTLSPEPPGILRMRAYRKDGERKDDNLVGTRSPSFRISHPVRRSGCVPAEPYPPTRPQQITNAFPTSKENEKINPQPTTMRHNLD